MNNTAILYLRLVRKIVLESAWRLGGADEILLATEFDSGDGDVALSAADCAERDRILLERESSARS